MKKNFLGLKALLLLFTFIFSNCQESAAQTKQNAEEFAKTIAKTGVQLVDVRTPSEYQSGHLANAQNINIGDADFKAKMEKLDKNKPIAVYCAVGGRSSRASQMLKEWGFKNVYDLAGGINSWKAAGKPVKQ